VQVHASGGGTALTGAGVVDDDVDAQRFGAWVEPHWRVMHRLALSLTGPDDVDDVLQEALLAAWRKRRQFDSERGSPQAWLLAIVADQARKQWARSRSRSRLALVTARDEDEPAERGGRETVLDMADAVRLLSPRQRLAVSLHYYLDLSVAEVAEAMACSVGTVKSTLSDARTRLHELLGDDY
jgi:RNA polymerase sigma-70 factor (ECF subfamily)